jgi:hypothetical protein
VNKLEFAGYSPHEDRSNEKFTKKVSSWTSQGNKKFSNPYTSDANQRNSLAPVLTLLHPILLDMRLLCFGI